MECLTEETAARYDHRPRVPAIHGFKQLANELRQDRGRGLLLGHDGEYSVGSCSPPCEAERASALDPSRRPPAMTSTRPCSGLRDARSDMVKAVAGQAIIRASAARPCGVPGHAVADYRFGSG